MSLRIAMLFRVFAAITICRFSSALLRNPSTRRNWSRILPLFSAETSDTIRSSAVYDRYEEEIELIDVAIIGGGPTGLACALSLLRASSSSSLPLSSVAIFESDTFRPKGASVVLQTTGWKALKCIDPETYKEARDGSTPLSAVYFKDFSGKLLLPSPIVFAIRRLVRPVLRLLGKGIVRANSWHGVRDSLRNGVQRAGSKLGYSMEDLIRSNTTLVSVDPVIRPDRVLLTFGDGRQVAASSVLACDGTFSTVRKSLNLLEDQSSNGSNKNRKPVLIDEGKTVWRGTSPNISPRGIGTFYVAQKEASVIGATAVVFPAGPTGGSSVAVIAPTSVSGRATGTEDARDRLKTVLANTNVPIDEDLMEAIDGAEHMIEHKIFCRDSVAHPDLASGYDRIAYFGDSAHPLRPTGEGLSVAMEDAWTIGHLFSKSGKGTISPEMFRTYNQERQGRVNAICKAVRNAAESYYDDDDESDGQNKSNDDEEEDPKEAQKRRRQNSKGVKGAMKDHPIKLSPL